jgi:DNA-binding transcriptional ArsR family regulator
MHLRDPLIPKVVQRLRALADERRIRLLLRLGESPADVATLTDFLDIAQASVSKHLAVLRQAGLVEVERRGTRAVYRVRDQSIFDLCRIVCDGVLRFAHEEHAALLATPARGSGRTAGPRAARSRHLSSSRFD